MKSVLIISKHFCALESIGSIRIRGLAQFLPRFGWNPVILTEGNSSDNRENVITIAPSRTRDENIEVGLSDFIGHRSSTVGKTLGKFATRMYKNIFWYPDPYHHFRDEGMKISRQLVLNNTFDAVLSSAHPASAHIIASSLASEFGIPWVADFRDLWTQNHYSSHFKVRTLVERRLEKKTLKGADALVTVSDPLSKKIAQLHTNQPVVTILNGFDPDQANQGDPLSEELTITYTGNLYKGRRDPTVLFKVLRETIDQNLIPSDSLTIHFYGKKEPWLYEAVEKFGLSDNVRIHGPVSRAVSIEKQRMSQILLLLTWDNPEENGVYTGKLFDYLAARRPIVSMGFTDGGVVKELLEDTDAGVHIPDVTSLQNFLVSSYNEFNHEGVIRYHGVESKIMQYSQIEMARKFAQVLDKVSSQDNRS